MKNAPCDERFVVERGITGFNSWIAPHNWEGFVLNFGDLSGLDEALRRAEQHDARAARLSALEWLTVGVHEVHTEDRAQRDACVVSGRRFQMVPSFLLVVTGAPGDFDVRGAMERIAAATIEVNGRSHEVDARIELLRDRATIHVDGVATPSTLVRRPFSSLFRYRFDVDATPWEVRVSPDGLRSVQVVIVPSAFAVEASGLSVGAIAVGSGVPGAVGALGLAGAGVVPVGPSLVIGLGTALGTFAIMWFVYGKRQQA